MRSYTWAGYLAMRTINLTGPTMAGGLSRHNVGRTGLYSILAVILANIMVIFLRVLRNQSESEVIA